MRFRIVPCEKIDNSLPERNIAENFLHTRLVTTLKAKAVCYNFFLQPNMNPADQPVEEPRAEWAEEKSPLFKVATLTIPQHARDDL